MVEPFLIKRLRFTPFALTVCALVASGGCSVPWYGGAYGRTETRKNPFTQEAAVTPGEAAPKTEEEALADVFDELQAIGEIDPLAREKLTGDLRSVKPEYWPLMVRQFKSTLAYRQQFVERDSPGAKTQGAPVSYTGEQRQSAASPMRESHAKVSDDSPAVVVSNAEPTVDGASEYALAQVAQPLPPPPVQRENVSAVVMATVVHGSRHRGCAVLVRRRRGLGHQRRLRPGGSIQTETQELAITFYQKHLGN